MTLLEYAIFKQIEGTKDRDIADLIAEMLCDSEACGRCVSLDEWELHFKARGEDWMRKAFIKLRRNYKRKLFALGEENIDSPLCLALEDFYKEHSHE